MLRNTMSVMDAWFNTVVQAVDMHTLHMHKCVGAEV